MSTFSVTQTPDFLQAVHNPMRVGVRKSDYKVGELFYIDVWTITDKNMRNASTPKTTGTLLGTRAINGPGDGSATFDISSILSQVFQSDDYDTAPTLSPYQAAKSESGYVGYWFKLGYITYNAQNQQVKTQEYELPEVQWAVRAALPLAESNANYFNSGRMADYCYRHDFEPVQYATSIPDTTKRNRSEDTLLPFFCPYRDAASGATLTATAELYFADGTTQTGYTLNTTQMTSGGLFVVNAFPGQFVLHPKYDDLTQYAVGISYSDSDNPDLTEIVRSRTFRVSKDIPYPNRVMFMNRLGGWDSIQVRRDTDTSIKFKSSSFQNTYGSRNYYVDASTSITYYSSYLTQAEFAWLKDLKLSPVIYLNGDYVLQQDGDFKLDTSVGLFNYELTIAPQQDENAIRL